MTEEKLKRGKEISDRIEEIEKYLHVYFCDRYSFSIGFVIKGGTTFHELKECSIQEYIRELVKGDLELEKFQLQKELKDL